MKKYFEVTHKKVFICNSAKRTEKFLKSLKSPGLRFAILDFKPSPQIKDFVSSLKGKDLTDKIFVDLDSFRSEYIRFMRDLNLKNRSLHWWAMNFTSKNPLLTGLYNRIFYVSRLARLIREEDFEHLIIFTSDVDIARKLKSIEGGLGAKVSWSIKQRSALKNLIVRILPIAIIYQAVNILCRRLLYLGRKSVFERHKRSGELHMIATPLEDKAFRGGVFEDAYFRSLRNFFRRKGINVMTVGLVSCKFRSLLANKEEDVFVFENFAKLSDITKHLIANLGFFFSKPKLKGLFKISNIDATDMVTSEIALSVNSGQIFLNLMVHSCTFNILERYNPKRVFYSFENRSWEKMIILAAAASSSEAKISGYQHASLTSKHTNFYLEKDEYREIPFPDEIITMGHVTKDLMGNLWNFPLDRLKVGCALRQSLAPGAQTKKSAGKIDKILIPLASSLEEYVGALEFLDKAFLKSQPYELIIRPHPIIDFEKALKVQLPRHIKYRLDTGPLRESLACADLVMYVSSTVSLEAIALGIPVICIALKDVLSPDPLFNGPSLKWDCADPEKLQNLIEEISGIEKGRFVEFQKEGQEYSRLYCIPATEESMKAFI